MNGALDSLDHSRGADSQQQEKTAAPVGSTTRLRRGSRAAAPIVGILGMISFEREKEKKGKERNAQRCHQLPMQLNESRMSVDCRTRGADGRWQMQARGVVVLKRQEAGTLSLPII